MTKLVVGLGNFGDKYDGTRHNVGFEVIDQLCGHFGITLDKRAHQAHYGKGAIIKTIFAKPQTYMNLSGLAVGQLVDYYDIALSNLLIIYDDIDIELGRVRVRTSGSGGTHNGMRNIIFNMQTEDIARVRVGIGRPDTATDLSAWVLGKWNANQREHIQTGIGQAIQEVIQWIGKI